MRSGISIVLSSNQYILEWRRSDCILESEEFIHPTSKDYKAFSIRKITKDPSDRWPSSPIFFTLFTISRTQLLIHGFVVSKLLYLFSKYNNRSFYYRINISENSSQAFILTVANRYITITYLLWIASWAILPGLASCKYLSHNNSM